MLTEIRLKGLKKKANDAMEKNAIFFLGGGVLRLRWLLTFNLPEGV